MVQIKKNRSQVNPFKNKFIFNSQPIIVTINDQASENGVAFSFAPSISNPLNLEMTITTVNPLPDGLSINPFTGVISGTPTTLGTTPVVINVDYGSGSVQSNEFDIFIWQAPSITDINEQDLITDEDYSFIPTVSNPSGFNLVFSLVGTLPDGISLNSSTGELSGSATTAQTLTNNRIRITYQFGVVNSNLFDFVVTMNLVPGYHVWLDPSDDNVVDLTDDVFNTITDKGSSGAILTGSGAARPSLGTLNSKRTIYIDSTSKSMKINNKTLGQCFIPDGDNVPGSWTLFMVVKPESVLSGGERWSFWADDTDTWNNFVSLKDVGAGDLLFGISSFSRSYDPATISNSTDPLVLALRYRATPTDFLDLWVNGVNVSSTLENRIPGIHTYKLGINVSTAGNDWLGGATPRVRDALIGDIIIYGPATTDISDNTGALSDGDVDSVNNFLKSKWGIS